MEFQIEHKIKGVTIFPSADDVITDAEQIINPNEDIVMGVETELVDVFGKIQEFNKKEEPLNNEDELLEEEEVEEDSSNGSDDFIIEEFDDQQVEQL